MTTNQKILGTILVDGEWIEGEIIFGEKIIALNGKNVGHPDPDAPGCGS